MAILTKAGLLNRKPKLMQVSLQSSPDFVMIRIISGLEREKFHELHSALKDAADFNVRFEQLKTLLVGMSLANEDGTGMFFDGTEESILDGQKFAQTLPTIDLDAIYDAAARFSRLIAESIEETAKN